jgi:glucose-6-phosphate 1-dehydrogenase
MRLIFQRPPKLNFGFSGEERPEPDQLVIKLDPQTGIRFRLEARRHGVYHPEAIELDMEFSEQGGEGATPYEVLLLAAMRGMSTRFTRQDCVEETWRVMQPLLDNPPPVSIYEPGTWGPTTSDQVVAGHDSWHQPWLAAAA